MHVSWTEPGSFRAHLPASCTEWGARLTARIEATWTGQAPPVTDTAEE